MTDFEQLLAGIARCTPEERGKIFQELRKEILLHPYEKILGTTAEIVLEAISRSGDFTQRGIRGIVAEATFARQILPSLKDWRDITKPGELAYDALVERDGKQARIQVKTQRLKQGSPMMAGSKHPDHYVVEIQRTRGGKDAEGNDTRPYRFDEFDVLAVCMWASTGDWKSFMFIPTKHLLPDSGNATRILKMQPVPKRPKEHWTMDLQRCLDDNF